MALHCPVIEKGDAPARPMFPVSKRKIIDGVHRLSALGTVVNAHRPANKCGLCVAVKMGGLADHCSEIAP